MSRAADARGPVVAMPELEAELDAIADELDALTSRLNERYARRHELWRKGKRRGLSATVLARASRVEPVTVRSILRRSP